MYLDSVKKIIKSNKYYEDLYDIVWQLGENTKIKKENYNYFLPSRNPAHEVFL